MLDLKTLLIVLAVNATLQGAVWLFVWSTQRHLYELRFIAAGYITFAVGLVLVILRGPAPEPWHVVLDNFLINLGIVMLADGLARFLNQPRYRWIGISCAIFTLVFWSLAMAFRPDDVAIRVHATTLVTTVMMLRMAWTLAMDRTQPKLLRWTTIVFLLEHVGASLARSFTLAGTPDLPEMTAKNVAAQTLYFFEINVFITAYFLCLLLMVGIRLSSDLRQKNDALSREVAERRRLQEQLSATLETEKALREEQRQLLRMVTHEFRTPLAVVDRAAEMIDVVLPERPDAVEKRLISIREAVQRLVQLIDRFLDAERLEQGAMEPAEVDLELLIGRVQRHFELMDSGDRLSYTVEQPLPRYSGDEDMLTTVLINLIDNALKYSPDDTVVSVRVGADAGQVTITVQDSGIGIPAAELRSVGRRFFRASNTKAATGTGLGLYNARRLIDYHHGELTLSAAPQGGTIATIVLPLPAAAESRHPQEAA